MSDDKKIEGGVSIGGNATVGGDIVGRDKITTTGFIKGAEFVKLLKQVKDLTPDDKQVEAEQMVAELQAQVQSKQPDVGLVGKSLKWLKKNVPGVSGVLSSVLNQPIIGQSIKDIASVILED